MDHISSVLGNETVSGGSGDDGGVKFLGGHDTSLENFTFGIGKDSIHSIEKFFFVHLKTFEDTTDSERAVGGGGVITRGDITAIGTVWD